MERYPNNFKNWELDKEAPLNFHSERVTIAERQGTSENEDTEGKPTPSKTNFSSCLGISAFDLDRTLIRGNSSASFCRFLYRENFLPFSVVLQSVLYSIRHRFFGMTLEDLHHSVFEKVVKGRPLEVLEKYVDRFVEEFLDNSLYVPAFARLKRAQQLGHYTMILSNAPSFIVKRFAKALGVNEYHATEYAVDEEKRFAKVKRILLGKDKANLIKKLADRLGIILDQITAYSDSFLDLEFLESAGNPIAVNPDKKLRAISVKKQWRII